MHLHYTDTPVVQRPSVNIQSLLLLAQPLSSQALSVPAPSHSPYASPYQAAHS